MRVGSDCVEGHAEETFRWDRGAQDLRHHLSVFQVYWEGMFLHRP
jgi:hypothetical protein